MAEQTSVDFQDVVVQLYDGTTYNSPCGFNQLTLTRSAQTAETNIFDCDDLTRPGRVDTGVVAVSQTISGVGTLQQATTLATTEVDDARTWMDAVGKAISLRILRYSDGATNATPTTIGYYDLTGVITEFTENSERGPKNTFDVTIVLNTHVDDAAWTDGAPV